MYSFTKAELKILLSVCYKSKDPSSRPNLQQVAFDGRHAVATDGNSLAVCTFDARAGDAEAPLFCVSRGALDAACKAAAKNDTITVEQQGLDWHVRVGRAFHRAGRSQWTFIPWRQVLDGRCEGDEPRAPAWSLDPRLLEVVVKLGKLLLEKLVLGVDIASVGCAIRAPKTDEDPTLITLENPDQDSGIRTWQVLIMPTRR